jgi:amylosucrase
VASWTPRGVAAAPLGPDALDELADVPRAEADLFAMRVDRSLADLAEPVERLYPDADGLVDRVLARCAAAWAARPERLRAVDLRADLEPDWFLRQDRVGYCLYVDRYAGTLPEVADHLDLLEELGVTYLHLMPLLRPRPGENDGGYSVMDYREVDPRLGTMDDLESLADTLRRHGIVVCLDLVLNHTAREHRWAEAARAGDPRYRAYYRVVEDRAEVDEWERTLPEVFPEQAPGSFTFDEDLDAWVWTTFHAHQWDLDWSNPEVLLEMLDVVFGLANRGVGVLRLDAVAFMWKRLGTDCQNLPEVHDLLQLLRAATRITCPSLLHKAEAIVPPGQLVPYLGTGRYSGRVSNLAYHNNLMVQFWSSLATGDVRLATHVLQHHFPTQHRNATWVTYVRCHDDIGWAITPEDAGPLGVDAFAHRDHLLAFYAGEVPGSWARGDRFGVNDTTGDARTVGTNASMCGLEAALEAGDDRAVDRAIDRILLGHALIASFGGMPVLFMGDELGLTNDWAYRDDPEHAWDTRWLHRPVMDWELAARRHVAGTVEQRVFDGVRHVLRRRAAVPAFRGDAPTEVLTAPDEAVLAVRRRHPVGDVLVLCNLADEWRGVPRGWAAANGATRFVDLLGGGEVTTPHGAVALPPYARLWLA